MEDRVYMEDCVLVRRLRIGESLIMQPHVDKPEFEFHLEL
jgi:hypothetical protein